MPLFSLLAFPVHRLRRLARGTALRIPHPDRSRLSLVLLAGLSACAPSVVLDARKAPAWTSPSPVQPCWTRSNGLPINPVERPDWSRLPGEVRNRLDWIPQQPDALLLQPLRWDLAFAHDPCRSDSASPYFVLHLHRGSRSDSLLLDSLRLPLPGARSAKWMALASYGFSGRGRLTPKLQIVAVNRMTSDAWARELARLPQPSSSSQYSLKHRWLKENAWLQDTAHHVLTLELVTEFANSRKLTDTLILDQDAWRLHHAKELP